MGTCRHERAVCGRPISDVVYLVDTNILSASAPTKAVTQPDLCNWMDVNSRHLFVSVITVAEIEDGISRSRRAGAHAKAGRLADWLETVLHLYADRVLPIDLPVARHIGALMDHARGQGHDPGLADVAIAATATLRGYTVLTRNLRHFAALGVKLIDPWVGLPPDAAIDISSRT